MLRILRSFSEGSAICVRSAVQVAGSPTNLSVCARTGTGVASTLGGGRFFSGAAAARSASVVSDERRPSPRSIQAAYETPMRHNESRDVVPLRRAGDQPTLLSRPGVGQLYVVSSLGRRKYISCGTCFIVDDDRGVILTAAHVVEAAHRSFRVSDITVSFVDDQTGRERGDFECELLSHVAPSTEGDADPMLLGDYWRRAPDCSDYRFIQVKNRDAWQRQGCTFVPATPPASRSPMKVCGFAAAPTQESYDRVYSNVSAAPKLAVLQRTFVGKQKIGTAGNTVSPVTGHLIAHDAPAWEGMSGGPCLEPTAQPLQSQNMIAFFGIHVGAPPFDDADIREVGDMYNLAVSVLQPDFQADYTTHVSSARATAGLPKLHAVDIA